jgi:hypothetical protein
MVGALWVGLMMAVAGDPAPAAQPSPPPAPPASRSFVAVMQPPNADGLLAEAASRICSELAASGLEGRLVVCEGTPCPDPAARETISLEREDGVVEINVRVLATDGLELGRHVRVISRDGGDDASVLAVRAVELLRDVRLNAQRPAAVGPQPPARDDEEPKVPAPLTPPPPPPRWLLTTGAAVLAAPGGNQPGIGPSPGLAFGAGAVLGPHVLVVASFAGPFDKSLGTMYAGTDAAFVQLLVTLELRYRFGLGPVEPFGALISGVNYLRESIPAGITSSAWVPLFGAGVGLSRDFLRRFTASFEIDTFVTQPDQLVNAGGQVIGHVGAPSILGTASAGFILP